MRLIVHIGTEKTGSTTLQAFLNDNREQLAKDGFALFQPECDATQLVRNNRHFVAMFQKDNRNDDYFRHHQLDGDEALNQFRQQVTAEFDQFLRDLPSDIHSVVLSSEHFHSRLQSAEEVQDFADFMKARFDDFRIIGYCREQSALCRSAYSTAVKSGEKRAFSDYQKMCRPQNHYYNYLRMFRFWRKAFGPKALRTRLFDKESLRNKDICRDFLGFRFLNNRLDLNRYNFDQPAYNLSLGPTGLQLILLINRLLDVQKIGPKRRHIRREMVLKIANMRGLNNGQVSLKDASAIYDSFNAQNMDFGKVFLREEKNPFSRPDA